MLNKTAIESALETSSSPTAFATNAELEVPTGDESDSLFEHFGRLYIFCREHLFRDDTRRIVRALWPTGKPHRGANLIELGCGPGFYSCALAKRFRRLTVLGVDSSARQLAWAQEKAESLGLENCHFQSDNVLDLPHPEGSFDSLVASRLFTVLPDRTRAVAEMYRVLRPGGKCFVAEPRYAFWASLPLLMMWLLAGLTRFRKGYREPISAKVLSEQEFDQLFRTQPWRAMRTWSDGRYQYALCKKG